MDRQRLSALWRWIFVTIGLVLMTGSHMAQTAERGPVPPQGLLAPEKPILMGSLHGTE